VMSANDTFGMLSISSSMLVWFCDCDCDCCGWCCAA
jgi:hypothetical protein